MLANLPERDLISRMGEQGQYLHQLARGKMPHLFQPIEPIFILEEYRDLDYPVESFDSLLFVISIMLEQLILRATARVLALASISIVLTLEGGDRHARTIQPALPTNDKQLWIKLLHLDIEAHPPNAAVLSLSLSAEPGRISTVQLGLFSQQLPEPTRLEVTLARIRAIVGDDCVGRAVLKDTHHYQGFRMEPFSVPLTSSSANPSNSARVVQRQFRPLEKISVTEQNRRPRVLIFREKQYIIVSVYGPWLTNVEWWETSHSSVEQWDVIGHAFDGNSLYCCLMRDLTHNCWYMEALYD